MGDDGGKANLMRFRLLRGLLKKAITRAATSTCHGAVPGHGSETGRARIPTTAAAGAAVQRRTPGGESRRGVPSSGQLDRQIPVDSDAGSGCPDPERAEDVLAEMDAILSSSDPSVRHSELATIEARVRLHLTKDNQLQRHSRPSPPSPVLPTATQAERTSQKADVPLALSGQSGSPTPAASVTRQAALDPGAFLQTGHLPLPGDGAHAAVEVPSIAPDRPGSTAAAARHHAKNGCDVASAVVADRGVCSSQSLEFAADTPGSASVARRALRPTSKSSTLVPRSVKRRAGNNVGQHLPKRGREVAPDQRAAASGVTVTVLPLTRENVEKLPDDLRRKPGPGRYHPNANKVCAWKSTFSTVGTPSADTSPRRS